MSQFDGVLPVHKPAGWTSHDVVAKVRGLLRIKKIGHAGTLDPDVTGVLPLAIGRATRLIEYMQEMAKAYTAEITIGYATDTEDRSGNVIERATHVELERDKVESVLASFVGTIEQVPPMFSAVRVEGKRLYELARKGLEVERQARKVTIHKLVLESFEPSGDYPKLVINVECSKGTYLRTLCKDIGKALGYPAVMSKLVRTMSCGLTLDQCLDLQTIADLCRSARIHEHIIAPGDALPHFARLQLEEHKAEKLLQGQKVSIRNERTEVADRLEPAGEDQLVRIFTSQQTFIGICRIRQNMLIPLKMFPTS